MDRSARSSRTVGILVGEFLRTGDERGRERAAIADVRSGEYIRLGKLHPSVRCSPVDALARS